MHVYSSLYLAKQHTCTFKMFEDVIVSYQLHNPESFKESKIKYLQLENCFFLKIRFTEQMILTSTKTDIYIYVCIYTYK